MATIMSYRDLENPAEANPTVLTCELTEEFCSFKTTIKDHLYLIGKVNLWGKWLHHLFTPMLTSQREFLWHVS
jgi:hypothetical protein